MGALNRWVYRVADGQLMMGPYLDPSVYPGDSVNYAVCDLPDTNPQPSPRLQRAASTTAVRAATSAEIDAYDLAIADAKTDSGLTDKDRYAIYATVLEKFDGTWAGMTNAQRKTAVQNLAARWVQWRRWADRNF